MHDWIRDLIRHTARGNAARPTLARKLAERIREDDDLDTAMPNGALPPNPDHEIRGAQDAKTHILTADRRRRRWWRRR